MSDKNTGLNKEISSIFGDIVKEEPKDVITEEVKPQKNTGLTKDVASIFGGDEKSGPESNPSSVLKKTFRKVASLETGYNKESGGKFDIESTKGVLGLDIGSSSIKAVWVKKGKIETAVYDIPFETPDAEKYQLIIKGLEKIIKENKPECKKARCVFSGDFVFVHHFRLPMMTEDELKNTVVWEAKKYIPSNIKDIILDFVVLRETIDKGAKKEEMILAAAEEKKFQAYLSSIRKAGLKPVKVNVSPFALLEVFGKSEKAGPEELTALIDIGAGKTNISIVKGQSLLFNRQVSIGGNSITAILSQDLRINIKEAEELKKNKQDLMSVNAREFAIIRPVLERISLEIERSFDYFSMSVGGKAKNIFISGGGAKLNGLDKFLSEKLNMAVKVYAPYINNCGLDTQFVVAAGAVLGEDKGINLLSAKVVAKKRFTFNFKLGGGLIKYAAAAVILFFFTAYMALSYVDKGYKQKIILENGRFSKLTAMADMVKEIDVLKHLDAERQGKGVLDEISRLIPDGVWIITLSVNKKGAINITGRSVSNQLVTGFLTNLSNSSLLKNASLLSTSNIEHFSGRNVTNFNITMELK
ncbi:MAG: type IV pilus assembly protein PilM [bacterium]|nr:type IV pilus assembly protein PilM [bacterium]